MDKKQVAKVAPLIPSKPVKKSSDANSKTTTKEISKKIEVPAIKNAAPKKDLSEVKPIVPEADESDSKENPGSLWSIVKNIFKQE